MIIDVILNELNTNSESLKKFNKLTSNQFVSPDKFSSYSTGDKIEFMLTAFSKDETKKPILQCLSGKYTDYSIMQMPTHYWQEILLVEFVKAYATFGTPFEKTLLAMDEIYTVLTKSETIYVKVDKN